MGGGPRRPQQKRPKAAPKIQEIGLTLHDYFFGKKIQLQFGRQKFCDQCRGEGAESFDQCTTCNGLGMRQQIIMIGPGMQAMTQGPCGPCAGEGKIAKGQCSKCKGSKFVSQEKILNITIEPGMKSGDVMKFPNECSDHHDYEEAGDVHIVMRDAEEKTTMVRKGDDLTTIIPVTLREVLLGTQKILYGHPAHPIGLKVDIPVGVMRGDIVVIKGEGMPRAGNATRGNLLLTIAIELKDAEKDVLKQHATELKAMFD
jgi:DnaJ family protein A protein 2